MIVCRSEAELRRRRAELGVATKSLGFVPTMGALHVGHMALVERARADNELCAVSIFVNPLQFGEGEDLARYPRPEERDLELCREAGVDLVLIGASSDLYPEGFATSVEVGERVTAGGEGAERPGHFRGVTTVVAKLFGIFAPTRAYFGWKDMQQCCVIQRMVRDLSMGVEVVPCEIVREGDGLACSSRNRYLDETERAQAPRLHAALVALREAWRGGEREARRLEANLRESLAGTFGVDYVEFRSELDYQRVDQLAGADGLRVVVAARLGPVRLLDNLALA